MKIIALSLALGLAMYATAQKPSLYTITDTFHLASTGGWDYVAVHGGRLYVSHGTQVNVLDEATGDSLGLIAPANGVHGIAFDSSGRGYTSNGRANTLTVFDVATLQILSQVPVGENPDAILYDPASRTVISCNGRSNDLSFVDASAGRLLNTLPVGGKPETAVADGRGRLFVNIEDKNEVIEVDTRQHTILHRWPLGKGEGPTGLAYDARTKRLFAGCEKLLVVLNAETGAVVATLPIGAGCDGVAFDPRTRRILTSNGEGTLSVFQELGPDKYLKLGDVPTKRGARTLTLDAARGTVFLPTVNFEPAAAGTRPRIIPGSFQVLVVRPLR